MLRETILIVEDNQDIRNIVRHILENLDYRVIEASDGQNGLEQAIKYNPDLIFLDMNLPVLSGLEMLAALRQTECHSPVIFTTVYSSDRIAVEAFRLGVRDYLVKPFTPDEVKDAIDRALSEARLAREKEELNRNLLTAAIVRTTVITLSHYLNNYLTTLKIGITLLEESLLQDHPNPELIKIVQDTRKSTLSIQAVIQVLLDTTNAQTTSYTSSVPILDIQTALTAKLSQLIEQEKRGNTEHFIPHPK